MKYKDYALANYPYLNTKGTSYELTLSQVLPNGKRERKSELFKIPETLWENGVQQEDLREILRINRVEIRAGDIKILFYDANKMLLNNEIVVACCNTTEQNHNKIYYRDNISFTMKNFVSISNAQYFQIMATYDVNEGIAAAAFTVFSLDPDPAKKDNSFLKMLDDYPFKEQHIRLFLLGEGGEMNFHPKSKVMRIELFKADGTSTIQNIPLGGIKINVSNYTSYRILSDASKFSIVVNQEQKNIHHITHIDAHMNEENYYSLPTDITSLEINGSMRGYASGSTAYLTFWQGASVVQEKLLQFGTDLIIDTVAFNTSFDLSPDRFSIEHPSADLTSDIDLFVSGTIGDSKKITDSTRYPIPQGLTYLVLTEPEEDFSEVFTTIEGMVQSGSISVNGSSAIRRTGSLQMIPDEDTINILSKDNLINVNTQFALEIGFTNPLPFYRENPIIWLPQGVFVTTQCSVKEDTRQVVLSLSFKDKSAFLNGELGGIIPAPFQLNTKDVITESGKIEEQPILIKEIAEGLLKVYSGFQDHEIDIQIPTKALAALKWVASNDAYLVEVTNGNKTQAAIFLDFAEASEQMDKWGSQATLRVIKENDSVGWQYTDFVYYDKAITAQAGDNIIALLNKLTNLFVNYEFYIDTYGIFRFKEKEGSLLDSSEVNYSYRFNDSNGQVAAYNNAPQYLNIKNDFILWGEQEVTDGYKSAFMYHLAFDNPKRQIYKVPVSQIQENSTSSKKTVMWHLEQWCEIPKDCNSFKVKGNGSLKIDVYYNKSAARAAQAMTEEIITLSSGVKNLWIGIADMVTPFTQTFEIVFLKDGEEVITKKQISTNARWVTPQHLFEQLFLMGPDDNYYYQELEANIYRMIDLSLADAQRKKAWDALEQAPYKAPYWLDLIYDESLENQMIYVKDVGRRTKVFSNVNVNCICENPNEVPYVIDLQGDKSDDFEISAIQLTVPKEWKGAFGLGGIRNGAREYIRSVMHNYISFNESVSITTNPIYYLEPNEVVYIERETSSIYGDFTISSFNVPLDTKSQMTIQCKRNLEMITSNK